MTEKKTPVIARSRGRRSNLRTVTVNRQYFVYILTNQGNRVLYTGITNNLVRRVYEHKHKLASGFTSDYNVNKLVYFEAFQHVYEAIVREKQIKGGSRQKKVALIEHTNAGWKDLYNEICA